MCAGIRCFQADKIGCRRGEMCTFFSANGCVYEKGKTYIVTEECCHGDWKTVLARPNDFRTLMVGEEVTFVTRMRNFEGQWATVRIKEGRTYDIPFSAIKYADMIPIRKGFYGLVGTVYHGMV